MPEDYGLIAMLAIFLAVFQLFIDSGFSSALIQKKDRSDVDYSTVFYFNLGISIFLFFLFFLLAPLIADFYKTPKLTLVTKIVSFNLIINALAVVPRTMFTVLIDFKTQAKASLAAVFISGTAGIWMAFSGYGVWALVFLSLLNNGINTLLLWMLSRWVPLLTFSYASFKQLFSFGSKLLLSGLLDVGYRNLYTLVIGKKYSAEDLGYYSRADQFVQFPSSNISGIIGRVAFPVMCSVQHDDDQLKKVFYKFLRLSAFIIFPSMIGLAVFSGLFIRLFLTEKWMGTVILMQIICFSYMWYPVHALNLTLLQAKGRSDLFLRLEIIKKTIGLIILFGTVFFGIKIMCIGLVVSSILCLYINVHYTKKHFDIGLYQQVKCLLPSLILSGCMSGLLFILIRFNLADIVLLLSGFSVGCIFYLGSAALFGMEEWKELRRFVISLLKKNG